jgi:hypothetical protein
MLRHFPDIAENAANSFISASRIYFKIESNLEQNHYKISQTILQKWDRNTWTGFKWLKW